MEERPVVRYFLVLMLSGGMCCGCAHRPKTATREKPQKSEGAEPANPILVRAQNDDACWEKTVDLLHDYFEIQKENRLDGVIETRPKVGASLLEPWHRDSAGLRNRLESTLQSIRRRAFVSVTSTSDGYLVGVEVFKEIEDVHHSGGNAAGSATFQENRPLHRDLRTLVGASTPEGWVSLGRDTTLEQRILLDLQQTFSAP